jgi:hypothetical protein
MKKEKKVDLEFRNKLKKTAITGAVVGVGVLGLSGLANATKITKGGVLDQQDKDLIGVSQLELSQDGKIKLNKTPSATDKATGITARMSVTTNTVGIGGLLHLHSTGAWVNADMNATTSMPCMALALGTTGTIDVLLNGIFTDTAWSWTAGGILYVNTNGTMTQSAPSGSGDQVQVVGIALSSTTIYFNPSSVLVEVV